MPHKFGVSTISCTQLATFLDVSYLATKVDWPINTYPLARSRSSKCTPIRKSRSDTRKVQNGCYAFWTYASLDALPMTYTAAAQGAIRNWGPAVEFRKYCYPVSRVIRAFLLRVSSRDYPNIFHFVKPRMRVAFSSFCCPRYWSLNRKPRACRTTSLSIEISLPRKPSASHEVGLEYTIKQRLQVLRLQFLRRSPRQIIKSSQSRLAPQPITR